MAGLDGAGHDDRWRAAFFSQNPFEGESVSLGAEGSDRRQTLIDLALAAEIEIFRS